MQKLSNSLSKFRVVNASTTSESPPLRQLEVLTLVILYGLEISTTTPHFGLAAACMTTSTHLWDKLGELLKSLIICRIFFFMKMSIQLDV
jgi:hypothetical protein